jgi:hypothetical protein
VAENEPPPHEAPTPPTGLPAIPAGPASPTPPPGLDADEYRRFQEFQRFQDYQRFVESGRGHTTAGMAPHAHTVGEQLAGVRQHLAELSATQTQIHRTLNPPPWKKILRNSWLHRAVLLAMIAILVAWGVPTLVQHYFGSSHTTSSPFQPKTQFPSGLPPDPLVQVASMYKWVARDDAVNACYQFSPAAARQFSQYWAGVSGSTCAQATHKLFKMVTNPDVYGYPDLSQVNEPPHATRMTISSCSYVVTDGPRLGTFTTTKQVAGWEITDYQGPTQCPSESVPPTS